MCQGKDGKKQIFTGFLGKTSKLCYTIKQRLAVETSEYLNDSGIALTEANRPFEAIPLFQRALLIDPENPLLWLNIGIAYQKTGEYKEALACFNKAVSIDDELAEAWGAMGLIHFELNDFHAAEDAYCAALERDPQSPKLWNNLGVLLFSKQNYKRARDCFEEALNIMPMYYDALYNLRDTCRELQDYHAAAEFERALSELKN